MKKSKRSLWSLVAFAGSFALGMRGSKRREAHAFDALKPKAGGPRKAGPRIAKPGNDAASTGSVVGAKARETNPGGDSSRGAAARAPQEIPARGWFDIGKRTVRKFSENELLSEAAGVTFYALLSLFPAITAIVSIYGLFADPATIQSHLDAASGLLPSGGMQIIDDQVKRLTASPAGGLSVGAVVGVLAALWSANQGTKAMFSALNDVYGEREGRGFVKLTALSLTFTVGGIFVMLIGIAIIVVLPLVFRFVGLDSAFVVIDRIARWPVVLVAIVAALAMLYRYGPSRQLARWRWVTWGGVIGACAWVGLSVGFSWYVEHFGSYNKTYGSLGAIIGFMTWIWLSTTVLLLGAQINAELETQTAVDSTVDGDKPLGKRGAKAADTVAAKG